MLIMDGKVLYHLLSLLINLNLCFGQYWSPITDDVKRLQEMKQNFPNDYVIPVNYIPKDTAGTCWVVLNIYPLEESLHKLANMFGAKSTNRESILIFITILQSVRVKFDHMTLEMMMQDFYCHYQEQSLLSGHYFDYVEDLLRIADKGTFDFSCDAPTCPSTQPTYTTSQGTSQPPQFLSTQKTPEVEEEKDNTRKRIFLLFVLIPVTACVAFLVWAVKSRRRLHGTENIQMQPTNKSQTVPASTKHD